MKNDEMELTHIDAEGRLRMVDVSDKGETVRVARARAVVKTSHGTLDLISRGEIPKGNVFEAARIGGIMAAKRTWDLIPLCHPLRLTGIQVDFQPHVESHTIEIFSEVKTKDRTGVEMEALVAVTHAALTIIDMCKAVDKYLEIHEVCMMFKSGGKSGTFERS